MIHKVVLGLLGVGIALSITPVAHMSAPLAGEPQWTSKTPMPSSRYGHHATVLDGRIYVLGGEHVDPTSSPTGAVDIYDPATDKWTPGKAMPTARGFFGTATVAGRIYAIGGSPNMGLRDPAIGTVEIYNPTTNSWSRGAEMPTPQASSMARSTRSAALGMSRSKRSASSRSTIP
jgi:hypothetical protein